MQQLSPLQHSNPPSLPPIKDINIISHKSKLQSGGTLVHQPHRPHDSAVTEECGKACQHFLRLKRLSQYEDHGYIFLFSYYPVQPVIQNGPICGMVALAMASELGRDKIVTTEEILSEARRRGLSKQGEMFSVSALRELAAYFLSCKVEHRHLTHSETSHCFHGRDLAEQLMARNLVLIPYDADKNHAPCQKRGHKAHWALLTGFFVALKASDVTEDLLSQCRREPDDPLLYYWPEDPNSVLCDLLAKLMCEKSEEFFLLGHHGKSKYAGLWALKDLLLSNDNLLEAGPERSSEEYVIPPGGVEVGLKSQMIIIHLKSDR